MHRTVAQGSRIEPAGRRRCAGDRPAEDRDADARWGLEPVQPRKHPTGQVMPRVKRTALVSGEQIAQSILIFRGHKVLLDEDLAALYAVATKVFLQAVKRNLHRFPADFMFQLNAAEWTVLRSQNVTSTPRGGRRYAPYVFTEQGVAMLSSVLSSERAIAINIEIMRAFVELRRLASSYAAIEKRLEEIERGMGEH